MIDLLREFSNRCRALAVDRRTVLGGIGSTLLLSSGISFSSLVPTPLSRIGLGATSFSDQLFVDGFAFTDGKRAARTTAELQRMMMSHGGNEAFTRLGSSRIVVGRRSGSGIAAALVRGALARSLDLPLNPELMLCAHYGDIGGQPEPDFSGFPEIKLSRPWHELGLAEMCEAMRIYGRLTAREILETGARVNVWDIGNEVEFGIAGVAIPPMVPTIGGAGWHYKAPDNVDPEIGKMTLGRFFAMAPPSRLPGARRTYGLTWAGSWLRWRPVSGSRSESGVRNSRKRNRLTDAGGFRWIL